jgi:CheY-like chemotaxis protein
VSRIYIVEDHDDIRRQLRILYEHEGHAVVEAADGREAIDIFECEAAQGRSFDIALLDYNLPHFKGDTVAVEMKRSALRHGVRFPRVIALTGSRDSKVLGRLEMAGVYEVVIKGGRDFDDYEALKNRIGAAA